MKTQLWSGVLLLLMISCGDGQKQRDRANDSVDAAFKPANEQQRIMQKQAVEAVIWGIPIVSMHAMRQAYFRDAGAHYGDIVFWSDPETWKNQTPTPNATTRTVYINFNMKNEPMVLEVPQANSAGLFGSITDAWQTPLIDVGPAGKDEGKGGRYLLLPPNYKGGTHHGYIPVQFGTYNGLAVLRIIPKDNSPEGLKHAMELVGNIRTYALSQAGKPINTRYIDMSEKLFDGITRFDAGFFDALAKMVAEEPMLPRDSYMIVPLNALGIGLGKPFQPDSMTRKLLTSAAQIAHTSVMRRAKSEGPLFYMNGHWRSVSLVGSATGYSFVIDGKLDAASRAVTFFRACAPPRTIGMASAYLLGYVDSKDEVLTGEHVYRLHMPAKIPVSQFWAITVYDAATATFFRNCEILNLDSYNKKMKVNADGSIDIYFAPKAPAGMESNWIATKPGRAWFTLLRFYGPQRPLYNKKWRLPDIEKID